MVSKCVTQKKPRRWATLIVLVLQATIFFKTKMMSCTHRPRLRGWAIETKPSWWAQFVVVVLEPTKQKKTRMMSVAHCLDLIGWMIKKKPQQQTWCSFVVVSEHATQKKQGLQATFVVLVFQAKQ
jgi:hypothetical protein